MPNNFWANNNVKALQCGVVANQYKPGNGDTKSFFISLDIERQPTSS